MEDLEAIVSKFANNLSALLQRHVNEALSGTTKAGTQRRGDTTVTSSRTVRGKGEKRNAIEMEQLRGKVLRAIEDHPGKRTEELNAVLGTTTKDLALPLRQLVAEKFVKAEGERRGTRYFITSKGSKA